MTGDQFRSTCAELGLRTVGNAARALGCSPRQVDRYRSPECAWVPAKVQRNLSLLGQVQELRAEVRRLTREIDQTITDMQGATNLTDEPVVQQILDHVADRLGKALR